MIELSNIPISSPDNLWKLSIGGAPVVRNLPPWCTAVGAWGDSLCSMGAAFNYPSYCRFLHYGYDPSIKDFMKAQHWIQDAVHIKPASPELYKTFIKNSAEEEDAKLWFVNPSNSSPIVSTHLRPSVTLARHIHRWHGARLPSYSLPGDLPPHFLLVQPFSTQSCPLREHWPHWEKAVELLLTFTPLHLVLVGTTNFARGSHPRVTNLAGKLSSMIEVFAIAERSEGLVTTCNSLSIWATIQNIRAVVLANTHLEEGSYFHRYIDTEPVKLLPHSSNLADLLAAVAETFDL